ncbi:hypothetical protein PG995_005725 [Apiospora arundinis]
MATPSETKGAAEASSTSSNPNPNSNSNSKNALIDQLAQVLPEKTKFAVHHLSTPPTLTEPLNNPPALPTEPNKDGAESSGASEVRARKPLKTYCEKHFLAVSIEHPESKEQLLVLALEVYLYTTSFSTVIFVSKADSTGYLNLLKLPQGTPRPSGRSRPPSLHTSSPSGGANTSSALSTCLPGRSRNTSSPAVLRTGEACLGRQGPGKVVVPSPQPFTGTVERKHIIGMGEGARLFDSAGLGAVRHPAPATSHTEG